MSQINYTDNYYGHQKRCPAGLYDCERHYCSEHRLLWRDCDTAKTGWEGDRDVIGGTREILEMGDCPDCEKQERIKREAREIAAWKAHYKGGNK